MNVGQVIAHMTVDVEDNNIPGCIGPAIGFPNATTWKDRDEIADFSAVVRLALLGEFCAFGSLVMLMQGEVWSLGRPRLL